MPSSTELIAIVIIAVVGFGGGWGIKSWKDGAELARSNAAKEAAESENAILHAANDNCIADIQNVKNQVDIIVSMVEEREKAASEAMKEADLLIAERRKRIKTTKNLPSVAPAEEAQCAAIISEQLDYVQARHDN